MTWKSEALFVLAGGLIGGSDQWYIIVPSMVVGAGAMAYLAVGKPVRSQIPLLVIGIGGAVMCWALGMSTVAAYFSLVGIAPVLVAFVSERLARRGSES